MSKSTIIVVAFVALASISVYEASPTEESLHSQWTQFKAQHGKRYASAAEEAKRLELFAENKLKVDKFNLEQSAQAGYTLAVNHLSDRTDEEFKQLLGYKKAAKQGRRLSDGGLSESLKRILESDDQVPDLVDWRDHGRVSSVKNQGKCGSCWAFSSVGVLEGQERPVKNISEPISLSPQNIMDCGFFSASPCDGGSMEMALTDVALKGGVESEADYPYLTAAGKCRFNQSLAVIANKGVALTPAGNELALKKVVSTYGPVSVAIEVSDGGNFRHYKSGVYTDGYCHQSGLYLNHGVLIVGYGTDPKEGDYWIVKNSWDTTWGDEGYVKMARNQGNMCGIATDGVIVSF